jgi:hypothetical protein
MSKQDLTSRKHSGKTHDAVMPPASAELTEVLLMELQQSPDADVLETAETFAELLNERINPVQVHDALQGHGELQERMVAQCLKDCRIEEVRTLIESHRVGMLLENKALRQQALEALPQDTARLLAEELLVQSRTDPKLQGEIIASIPPEQLLDIGEQGRDALRHRAGLNSVRPQQISTIPKIIDRAKTELSALTGSNEVGSALVEHCLEYPQSHFTRESSSRDGKRVPPLGLSWD